MLPKDFVAKYLPFAKQAEDTTGISAIATLAQAAVESAWGDAAPGYSFFGVKDTDGTNGNEQLEITTEYSRRNNLRFPAIISVTPVTLHGVKMFKYVVKDYFRKYKDPSESFIDHNNFFVNNERYADAMAVKSDPIKFLDAIAKAGYATDPNYEHTLTSVAKMISQYV